eukprot:14090815-Alexandrium_andersonii.AAC.1
MRPPSGRTACPDVGSLRPTARGEWPTAGNRKGHLLAPRANPEHQRRRKRGGKDIAHLIWEDQARPAPLRDWWAAA